MPGYKYCECDKCKSFYLNDGRITSQVELSKAHMDMWYGAQSFSFEPERPIEERVNLLKGEAAGLIDRFSLGDSSRVLDVGCGEGELVAAMSLVGIDVFGFEPNVEAFPVVGVNGGLKDRLFCCSIEDLYGRPDGLGSLHYSMGSRFDLIILRDVLEHLFDPLGFLQFVFDELLAINGHVFITIPSGDSLQVRYLKEFAWNFMAPFHRTLFSAVGVEQIVSRLSCSVHVDFIENNRRVWGNTRAVSWLAGFEDKYSELRDKYDGFSRYDYLVDDLIDRLSFELKRPPALTFSLSRATVS